MVSTEQRPRWRSIRKQAAAILQRHQAEFAAIAHPTPEIASQVRLVLPTLRALRGTLALGLAAFLLVPRADIAVAQVYVSPSMDMWNYMRTQQMFAGQERGAAIVNGILEDERRQREDILDKLPPANVLQQQLTIVAPHDDAVGKLVAQLTATEQQKAQVLSVYHKFASAMIAPDGTTSFERGMALMVVMSYMIYENKSTFPKDLFTAVDGSMSLLLAEKQVRQLITIKPEQKAGLFVAPLFTAAAISVENISAKDASRQDAKKALLQLGFDPDKVPSAELPKYLNNIPL